jgi:hypothetical protein
MHIQVIESISWSGAPLMSIPAHPALKSHEGNRFKPGSQNIVNILLISTVKTLIYYSVFCKESEWEADVLKIVERL